MTNGYKLLQNLQVSTEINYLAWKEECALTHWQQGLSFNKVVPSEKGLVYHGNKFSLILVLLSNGRRILVANGPFSLRDKSIQFRIASMQVEY